MTTGYIFNFTFNDISIRCAMYTFSRKHKTLIAFMTNPEVFTLRSTVRFEIRHGLGTQTEPITTPPFDEL